MVFTDFSFKPLKYSFTADTLFKRFTLKYPWEPDSTYRVILDKNFAEDSAGKKLLKTDTILFKAKKLSEYASIRLLFPKLDLAKNPVLQFVLSDKVVDSSILTTREFARKLFKPGDYELRILYDANKNGKWDPGSFFGKHLQPEKVILVPKLFKAKGNLEQRESYEF